METIVESTLNVDWKYNWMDYRFMPTFADCRAVLKEEMSSAHGV
jgi:hypothetical protein